VVTLEFCSKGRSGDFLGFNLEDFYEEVRETIAFGKQAYRTWWEPDNTPSAAFSWKLVKDGLPEKPAEEWMKDIHAWLHHHRANRADEWDWAKATESQAHKDRHVRIPRSRAPPMRDCLRQGYVTRCVPIAHHTLPAISASGRIFESDGDWVDSRMARNDANEGPCENPGIYTFESLNDRNKFGMATDVLGDGHTYMIIVEVQVLEGNKTAVQPPRWQ
jgi:hypothetical protein